MRTTLSLIGLLTLALFAGCSDGLVDVSGTVTVGDEPVEEGRIRFLQADGTAPQGAVITQGKYSAKLSKGEKVVEIQGQKKVGEKIHDPTMLDSPMVPVMEEMVPRKYHSNSPLTATIDEPREDLNFELETE
jgi:hypothetical protein